MEATQTKLGVIAGGAGEETQEAQEMQETQEAQPQTSTQQPQSQPQAQTQAASSASKASAAATKTQAPHSVEAEQALLGLLMLDNERFDELEGFLTPEHFYLDFHKQIFKTIETLIIKGFEANPITISENMVNADGDLMEHVVPIMENASLANRAKNLAEIIHNYHIQRELIKAGNELTGTATDLANENKQDGLSDIISTTESALFRLGEAGGNKTGATDLVNPLKSIIAQVEEAKKNQGKLLGVTSGLADIDKKLGGFQKSDLIILAARPSMGKTAFCVNVAQNAASAFMGGDINGAPVGLFSMEMSAEQLTTRILSGAAGIESTKLQSGDLSDDEFGRLVGVSNSLYDMKLYIDDTPQLSIGSLRSRARRMVRQYGVGMIIVDYLQLMRGSGGVGMNRVQEISEISMGLKALARELNLPVMALSQLSRSVENRENKRPQLADLRESGSIEQDADIVMFLYREDYYLEKQMSATPTEEEQAALNEVRGVTELLVSKNRKGPTNKILLTFDAAHTTFKDHASNVAYQ